MGEESIAREVEGKRRKESKEKGKSLYAHGRSGNQTGVKKKKKEEKSQTEVAQDPPGLGLYFT